jgi:hypothetical protein
MATEGRLRCFLTKGEKMMTRAIRNTDEFAELLDFVQSRLILPAEAVLPVEPVECKENAKKFHYTGSEVFFKDVKCISVEEVRKLLCAMKHCTSSCYYHELFSKAMYELCPDACEAVEGFLAEWSSDEDARACAAGQHR